MKSILGISILIWILVAIFGGDDQSKYDSSSYIQPASVYSGGYNDSYEYEEKSYPVGFSGTEEMEACNNDTGSCYALEIDSDGENVERINFPSGGWRDVDYSDCYDGSCTVEDEDGTEWDLEY